MAEVIPRTLKLVSRPICWVDLGMHNMCFGNKDSDKIMHMSGEAFKSGLFTPKSVDVDKQ